MAFDLASAKPVGEAASSGFDLSTAKPVDEADYSHEGRARPPSRKKAYRPHDEGEAMADAGAFALGTPEAALQVATGLGASVVGGLVGVGDTVRHLAKGDTLSDSLEAGGGTARKVQEAGTFQPRSEGGKAVSHAISLPLEVANKLLGKTGGALGSVVGPRAEAAGETIGENIIPAVLAAEGGRRAVTRPLEEAQPVPGRGVTPLRQLSMEEEQRYRRQQQAGVKPTLGSVTRDPSQVRFESQTAMTEAGVPLYQRGLENDAAVAKKVSDIKEQPATKGSKNESAAETGRSVRKAVEAKKAARDQEVNEAYDKARASGETKAEVDVTPLVKYLKDNEPASITVKPLKSISAGLRKLMGVAEDEAPAPVGSGKISGRIKQPKAEAEAPKVTIDDLEFLRREAGKLGESDPSTRSYMNAVRDTIDKITEGKGGDLYKAARAKRRAVGMEFEEQGSVANIIDKKSATDYKVAGEDVWHKTVVAGGTEDLANVIKTLRTADPKQKPQSLQALKDMQARTIDMIVEEGTKTGTLSKAGLERGIKAVGLEKLELLLGKDAVKTLQDTVKTAEELKTQPLRAPGSDTLANARVMAEKSAADHGMALMKGVLPAPLRYAAKAVDMFKEGAAKRAEKARQAGQIDEALTPTRAPLADIAKQGAEVSRARRKYLMSEAGKRSVAPIAATVDEESNR